MGIPVGFQRVRQHLPCLPTFKTEGSSSRGNLVTTVGFVTKSGMTSFALSLPIFTSHSDWIIVTGDTNQMTRDTINLAIYPQDCSRSVIINANGVVISSCWSWHYASVLCYPLYLSLMFYLSHY